MWGRMVFRTLADGLEHQLHLDDQQDGVDHHEARNREEHGGGTQVRDGHGGGQHPLDDPGLASQLGHEPAALDGDPGQRDGEHGNPQQPRVGIQPAACRQPEERGGQQDQEQAHADHGTEREEQRGHLRHRVPGRAADLLGRGLTGIVHITLEQQCIAQRMAVFLEDGTLRRGGVELALGGTDLLQGVIGLQTVADVMLGALDQILDAGDFRVERARADQAHDPGHVHGIVRLAGFLVRKTEGRERGRGRLGVPDGLDGRQFHLLVFRREVAAFVTAWPAAGAGP